MSFLEVFPEIKFQKISIGGSKSYANRFLILAAINESSVTVSNVSYAQDVEDMLKALKSLGLKIIRDNYNVTIENSFPACLNKDTTIEAGEGGTTSRFLVALCSLSKFSITICAKGKMQTRPMGDLYKSLSELGVKVDQLESTSFPVRVKGPILKRSTTVNCSKTTQGFSALRLISKKANLEVIAENISSSQKYIEITNYCLNQEKYQVPLDFSSASYFIVLATLKKDLVIQDCHKIDDRQGDAKLIELINSIGGKTSFTDEGLKITHVQNLSSFEVDCSSCLDLTATLAVLAAFTKGKSRLKNLQNLQHKESDRLLEIQKILTHFGVSFTLCDDDLVIQGESFNLDYPRTIEVVYDHRMAMMAALFFKLLNGGKLTNADSVKKSCPEFFNYV